jgi:cytosine/adenosine deaminase-related metal-dependent hydrolase
MSTTTLLIQNCLVLQLDLSILPNAAIRVDGNRIPRIESQKEMEGVVPGLEFLDAQGKPARPGFRDGKLWLKDRQFLQMDETEIQKKAGEAPLKIGKKANLAMNAPYPG